MALDPLVEYFEMSMLAGAMFLSIFEMQIYLSLKKSIFLGIIIPIAIFLYCIYDVWKGSLTAALHFLFYDSERAIPFLDEDLELKKDELELCCLALGTGNSGSEDFNGGLYPVQTGTAG